MQNTGRKLFLIFESYILSDWVLHPSFTCLFLSALPLLIYLLIAVVYLHSHRIIYSPLAYAYQRKHFQDFLPTLMYYE